MAVKCRPARRRHGNGGVRAQPADKTTMTAAIALPRQPHNDWLARIRTVGLGLGGRGVMGFGLGGSSVGAARVLELAAEQ